MEPKYKIFDTHAHYDDEAFDEDREEVLKQIQEAGVIGVLNCACSRKSLTTTNELTLKYDFIYGALGIHPSDAYDYNEDVRAEIIEKANSNKKILAIGEIGLDYHYTKENKDKQKELFITQIKLANKYNLPIVIHSRDAVKDTIDILKEYKSFGVIHCFSESLEIAKEYINLGYKLGIGGVLTFKNSNLKETIKNISIENIVLETDSPFLSPIRGSINEPKNIKLIAEYLSEVKEISLNEVANITTKNANTTFGLHIKKM